MGKIVAVADNPQQRHGIDRLPLLSQLGQQCPLNGAVSPTHNGLNPAGCVDKRSFIVSIKTMMVRSVK
jgi:hypothetical protein